MLCYTLSFVDRQILGLLVPFIKSDLKINDTLVGLLAGTAFAIFYAVMGLPLVLLMMVKLSPDFDGKLSSAESVAPEMFPAPVSTS